MTVALWDVAEITAVADAIRAKKGTSNTMKVSEMPAEIASIPSGSPEVWKECWLEKPKGSPTTLFIDTGITADPNHELTLTVRSSAAEMSAPFNSCTDSGNRYGINFLPGTNKVQLFWGTYANTSISVTRDSLDVVQPMIITQNKSGISISGYGSGGNVKTWSQTYTGAGSGTNATYKLFTYARNTGIHFGLFRSAEIKNASSETIATIVPEVDNNFVARLKITEGENVRYVPVAAGFVCHVDNVAAS